MSSLSEGASIGSLWRKEVALLGRVPGGRKDKRDAKERIS